MRWLLIILLLGGPARAQTSSVSPDDVQLTVTVENAGTEPYQGEMILITIHGVYRRHITLEKLETPDLAGFNWMQLGQDHWFDTQVRGIKVKNFRRRMALFPETTGEVTIPPFVHHLTLTDEGDDWFAHDIASEPVTLTVRPAPSVDGWWFPVRRLEIEDQWSNAPDQLQDGEGVLRVIRITAVGVSPDMIPPMPDLVSPSAMIFPHPEKRFVELSPQGPVAIAFWRWTIRPTNSTSAIIEPITFPYFDTTTRQAHEVTITAQRVAMDLSTLPEPVPPQDQVEQHPGIVVAAGALALAAGLSLLLAGQRFAPSQLSHRFAVFDPMRISLMRAARRGDRAGVRRAATALLDRHGPSPAAEHRLLAFDTAIFGRAQSPPDCRRFARDFLSAIRVKSSGSTAT